jgi:hypothetical protein
MSDYQIEKGVPLPHRLSPFNLDDMEVGDSFLVKVHDKRERQTVSQRLFRYRKNNFPKDIIFASIDDSTVRIFRVEDRE